MTDNNTATIPVSVACPHCQAAFEMHIGVSAAIVTPAPVIEQPTPVEAEVVPAPKKRRKGGKE